MIRHEDTPAIEVEGLGKRYPSEVGLPLPWRRSGRWVDVLRDVALTVAPGEIYGLLGPNGAGKSTLMKVLATLVLPDAGTARIHGIDVVADPALAREGLGVMLEQERSFYGRLTGRQNLRFFAALYDRFGDEVERRIDELLELVGLEDAADRWFQKYSLGMQHRLGLARALIPEPDVLLLDEPTRSLDPDGADALCEILRRLPVERGTTILLLSHDLDVVSRLCRRVGLLVRGRIVADGPPDTLGEQLGCATLRQAYSRLVAEAGDDA